MISKMLYDAFANMYVLEGDPFAPPERYIEALKGPTGIYIETWDVGDHRRLDISYTIEEYYDTKLHSAKFKLMCEKYNCTPKKLCYFTLPKEKFDEYVKRFHLEE